MHIPGSISKSAMIGTVMLMLVGSSTAFSRDMYETIDAQSFGTGTQMGANIASP